MKFLKNTHVLRTIISILIVLLLASPFIVIELRDWFFNTQFESACQSLSEDAKTNDDKTRCLAKLEDFNLYISQSQSIPDFLYSIHRDPQNEVIVPHALGYGYEMWLLFAYYRDTQLYLYALTELENDYVLEASFYNKELDEETITLIFDEYEYHLLKDVFDEDMRPLIDLETIEGMVI